MCTKLYRKSMKMCRLCKLKMATILLKCIKYYCSRLVAHKFILVIKVGNKNARSENWNPMLARRQGKKIKISLPVIFYYTKLNLSDGRNWQSCRYHKFPAATAAATAAATLTFNRKKYAIYVCVRCAYISALASPI